jgi:hypothetical protein
MAIGQQWCHSPHRANVSSSTWATVSGTSQLRKLLPQVLSDSDPVKWFDAERGFPALGRTNLLLNALRFAPIGDDAEWILLAIEDDSDHTRADALMNEGG